MCGFREKLNTHILIFKLTIGFIFFSFLNNTYTNMEIMEKSKVLDVRTFFLLTTR